MVQLAALPDALAISVIDTLIQTGPISIGNVSGYEPPLQCEDPRNHSPIPKPTLLSICFRVNAFSFRFRTA